MVVSVIIPYNALLDYANLLLIAWNFILDLSRKLQIFYSLFSVWYADNSNLLQYLVS
jgi:hypothetical protein